MNFKISSVTYWSDLWMDFEDNKVYQFSSAKLLVGEWKNEFALFNSGLLTSQTEFQIEIEYPIMNRLVTRNTNIS